MIWDWSVTSLNIDGSFSLVLWPLSLFVSELLAPSICLTFIELSFEWCVQSYISNNFRAPTRPYMIYSLNNITQIRRVRGSQRERCSISYFKYAATLYLCFISESWYYIHEIASLIWYCKVWYKRNWPSCESQVLTAAI